MLHNAINTGVADTVQRAGAMAEAIETLVKEILSDTRNVESPEFEAGLRTVVDILRVRAGHDFRCYKSGTLGAESARG